MKKVVPFALLLCMSLSFSGLNAADSHSLKAPLKQEAAKPMIEGVLEGSPYGPIYWSINSGTITYSNNGTYYGPYTFSGNQAAGPKALGIIYVTLVNGSPVFTTIW
ncbi:hypothetical protein L3C95_29430 [Chitinophaga filiformis]|uniref:hypothetical protein n=1 Tax=Chitinophaga filiformis TaxID=104663 RepID=UPI001F16FF5F|nr:hypothetical protein [Chitinophaga filiformis]MCF6407055.1 hypothetical protein [Chitinophaga filiformis]